MGTSQQVRPAAGGYGAARPQWRVLAGLAVAHMLAGTAALLASHNVPGRQAEQRMAVFEARPVPAPSPPPAPPPTTTLPDIEVIVPEPIVETDVVRPDTVLAANLSVAEAPVVPQVVQPVSAPPHPSLPPMPRAVTRDLVATVVAAEPPRYPLAARRAHEQGIVVLAVRVGIDGRVEEVRVERSSGSERLDTAALSAVRRWRWSPTLVDGQAVVVSGLVEIPFKLTNLQGN